MGSKHYISESILLGEEKVSDPGQFGKAQSQEPQANVWNFPVDLSVCHDSKQDNIWLMVRSSHAEQHQMQWHSPESIQMELKKYKQNHTFWINCFMILLMRGGPGHG